MYNTLIYQAQISKVSTSDIYYLFPILDQPIVTLEMADWARTKEMGQLESVLPPTINHATWHVKANPALEGMIPSLFTS